MAGVRVGLQPNGTLVHIAGNGLPNEVTAHRVEGFLADFGTFVGDCRQQLRNHQASVGVVENALDFGELV